jgi:hypothetical protein
VPALLGICLVVGTSRSASQENAQHVAYVEAVSGHAIALLRDRPTLLEPLDVIGDRTRLDLPSGSELRICHFRLRRLITLRGPLRASISASGVTAEHGKGPNVSAETCVEPVVSTFQGGFVTRNIALTTLKVPLRPSIRVINQGNANIRRIALWDGTQQAVVAAFDRNAARPVFDEGRSYLLVIEQGDGRELKTLLQASAQTRTGPLILVLP